MKERYNVEISDVKLTIVSDEPEDFVLSVVEKINERVNDMISRGRGVSKLDAAFLCALDYCAEYQKAERRIRNLEAQISLYDANLKRLREEVAAKSDAPEKVKTALGVAGAPAPADGGADAKVSGKTEATPRHQRPARDQKQIEDTETVSMLEGESGPEEAKDEKSESTRAKLEEIEKLLRKSDD